MQVDYGLLTDARGYPVAVSVFDGNTAGFNTFLPEVRRVRYRFGLVEVVAAPDRGMMSHRSIDELRGKAGIDWITVLKSVSIRALFEQEQLQLGQFDRHNLAEIFSWRPLQPVCKPASSAAQTRLSCRWSNSSTALNRRHQNKPRNVLNVSILLTKKINYL